MPNQAVVTEPPMTSLAAATARITLRRGGTDSLDELEPLWNAMQAHHTAVAARVRDEWEFRGRRDSWQRRRASYAAWLEQPGAFLLLAEHNGTLAGYLFGRPTTGWTVIDTGDRIGEVESLTVTAQLRDHGIGHRLMAHAHQEFAALGIKTIGLSVFAENADAIRFYEAHGMVPATITYLGPVRTQPAASE